MASLKLLRRRAGTVTSGDYASFVHIILTAVLPLLLYVLVILGFSPLAFSLVVLSKWRMFAVKSRHWFANIRANAVDIFAGFSAIMYMSATTERRWQLLVVAAYTAWLLFIKPQSSAFWVGAQALISQTLMLSAVFLQWSDASETWLTIAVWAVTYLSARHFLSVYDEAMARATAYVWAFFCASLTWLSVHWLLYYRSVSQPALIITVIAYGVGVLYYLQHTDKMKKGIRRQFIVLMVAVVMFILAFSDWSGDII